MTSEMKFIIYVVLVSLLYTCELCVVIDLFMQRSKLQIKKTIAYMTILSVVYGLFINYGVYQKGWYIFCTVILLNHFLHRGKKLTYIWSISVAYAVVSASKSIVDIGVNKICKLVHCIEVDIWTVEILIHIMTLLMVVGLSYLFQHTSVYKKDKSKYEDLSNLKVVGIILMSSIYSIIFNILNEIYISKEHMVIGSGIIFFAVYFTMFVMGMMIIRNQYMLKKEYDFREQNIIQQLATSQLITYERLKCFKTHYTDLKQGLQREVDEMIACIGPSIQMNIMPYMKRIKEEIVCKPQNTKTGYEILDIILYEKTVQAQKSDITLYTDIILPKYLNLDVMSLIVSTIIDYVVIHCEEEQIKHQFIRIHGESIDKQLLWTISYKKDMRKIIYRNIEDIEGFETLAKYIRKCHGNIKFIEQEDIRVVKVGFNMEGEDYDQ